MEVRDVDKDRGEEYFFEDMFKTIIDKIVEFRHVFSGEHHGRPSNSVATQDRLGWYLHT